MMHNERSWTRAGFALPTTILLLLCMTAGVVAAFGRVAADVRVVDNQRAETVAFAVAEAGLQRYLARGLTTPADTTMVLDGGSARVRLTLVRSTTTSDTTLYVIRSDGVVAGGASVPQGRRIVAQYVYHVRGQIRASATWTAVGGLTKAGSSGMISGANACGPDSVAAVSVPDGMYTQHGGGHNPLVGSPSLEQMGTVGAFANDLRIDWRAITQPLTPAANVDVIVCYPGTDGYDSRLGPCGAWPAKAAWADAEYWPAILVNGSVRLPSSGRGTLLVTGDLTLRGGDEWDGIIMVGDRLTDNGTGRVAGAVFSGMNAVSGKPVERSDANGTKHYQYNSCAIAKAAARQSWFVPISNAWVDNWATW